MNRTAPLNYCPDLLHYARRETREVMVGNVGVGGDTFTGINAATGIPNVTANGNWANLGYVAVHPFETGTTNALTFTNSAGVTGNLPRADRKRIGELFQSQPQDFVRVATVDNYYTAFIGNRRNFRQTVTAGYTQLDVSPVSRLTLRGGVRVEQTENRFVQYDPHPNPRNYARSPVMWWVNRFYTVVIAGCCGAIDEGMCVLVESNTASARLTIAVTPR